MIPKLLIGAGAMKAGTTWLYRQLDSHPRIHFTPVKELCYFSYTNGIGKQLSHEMRNRKLQQMLSRKTNAKTLKWFENYAHPDKPDDQWYCSLFEGCTDDAYCADFSNLYSLLPEDALKGIYRVAKDIKVIYTMRDPLERLWSHVKFHHKFIGDEGSVERMSDNQFTKFINNPAFWNNAEYLKNYQSLVNAFGKKQVKLFYLEDFTAFPQGSLWNLEKFLGISHIEFLPDIAKKKINKSKEMVMPASWKEIALEKLKPIYETLHEERLNHPSWRW